ncbi:Hsp33 family molecular chaperone HslO [Bacteroidota bacterium]
MSKKNKETQKLIEQIKLRDRVVRVMSEDGKFRFACIKNTNSAKTAQQKHKLPYQAAFLLSRSLAAASMMSSFLKGEERITIEIEGDGPVSYVYAEALQVGELRGFVNYNSGLSGMKLSSISELLGDGLLRVIRITYDNKEPLSSVIELQKGDVATDIAYYFAQSEQVPSAVILDVDFDDNGIVKQSGGILLQAMPGATQKDIEKVYESISSIKSLVEYYEQGLTPDKVLKEVLPFDFNLIGSTPVDFFCRCSKENFIEKLLTLEPKEIEEMQESGQNELICRYCNNKYYLDDNDFSRLIEETKAKKN